MELLSHQVIYNFTFLYRKTQNTRFYRERIKRYGKITERVWSGRVHSLFSKARSPPYCFPVLLDPRMYFSYSLLTLVTFYDKSRTFCVYVSFFFTCFVLWPVRIALVSATHVILEFWSNVSYARSKTKRSVNIKQKDF